MKIKWEIYHGNPKFGSLAEWGGYEHLDNPVKIPHV